MIDLHCHILPELDDGARTLEESLVLAEMLVQEGVTTVVATPHVFDLRYPTPTPDQIQDRLIQLQRHLDGRLRVVGGAEVRLVPELMTVLHRQDLYINGGSYMLIEFPDDLIPPGIERLVFRLTSAGIRPIIAHPERHRGFLADAGRLKAFINLGCYAQLDAPCLLRKDEIRRTALRWIDSGLIHVVASDAHRRHWRPPRLTEPYREVEKHRGADMARALFVDNPQAVVEGVPLPFVPELRSSSRSVISWWQRLQRSR